MSAQTFAEAFAPAEAANKARVMGATWGHLAPKTQTKYAGTILFAHGEYGDLVPLRTAFEGLPDSPWFFSDMQDWIAQQRTEAGQVYFFRGTYQKFKTGGFRFVGHCRPIHINP